MLRIGCSLALYLFSPTQNTFTLTHFGVSAVFAAVDIFLSTSLSFVSSMLSSTIACQSFVHALDNLWNGVLRYATHSISISTAQKLPLTIGGAKKKKKEELTYRALRDGKPDMVLVVSDQVQALRLYKDRQSYHAGSEAEVLREDSISCAHLKISNMPLRATSFAGGSRVGKVSGWKNKCQIRAMEFTWARTKVDRNDENEDGRWRWGNSATC